jgi:LacI family transcriptional regulator
VAPRDGSGKARATIYDVARVAGVSSATVSRVFAGRAAVAPDTRREVLESARALGYRPNTVARALATQEADTIALLLPDITNPFFPSLVKELQAEAGKAGLTLLLCDTEDDVDVERRYLDTLLSKQISHVLVIGLRLDRAGIEEYTAAGLTFVALDRAIPSSDALLVQSDNREGARMAVRHLVDLGHERIAHLAGPSGLSVSRDRARGYRDALEAAGIAHDPALVLGGAFSEEGGAQALDQLLATGVEHTAIFAANDLIAIGALFAAHERGLRVPEDLSIVGFDDVSLTRYTSPQITTVRQNVPAIARAAVGFVQDEVPARRRRKVTLPVRLEIRQSTALRTVRR